MDKVKVFDSRNDFRLLCEIDYSLACALNVGNSISPDKTGFSFIVVHKYVAIDFKETDYSLSINVVEYETLIQKIKRKLFGIKSYGYWDYFKNKESWT